MDFLKTVLGDELYQQVATKLAGNDKIKLANLANGEYVSKDKYSASETLANERKTQLEAVNVQLEEMKAKASASGNSDLQGKIIELQNKYNADTQALNERLAKQRKDSAFNMALIGSKPKNIKAVTALFDLEKINVKEDGAIDGFKEQLEAIQKENGYLFDSGVPGGTGGVSNGLGDTPTNDGFKFELPSVVKK